MLCRSNPSHRYTEPISDSDRVNLARNIQYVMMSAFKGDFPIPSTQEIREWLRDDNNREYLFTYSEESSSSKFGELKALIGAQKHLTRDSLYEHLELDATREQLDQTFSDYAILRPFRSQVEDLKSTRAVNVSCLCCISHRPQMKETLRSAIMRLVCSCLLQDKFF